MNVTGEERNNAIEKNGVQRGVISTTRVTNPATSPREFSTCIVNT
jgi:hypothetical protein